MKGQWRLVLIWDGVGSRLPQSDRRRITFAWEDVVETFLYLLFTNKVA